MFIIASTEEVSLHLFIYLFFFWPELMYNVHIFNNSQYKNVFVQLNFKAVTVKYFTEVHRTWLSLIYVIDLSVTCTMALTDIFFFWNFIMAFSIWEQRFINLLIKTQSWAMSLFKWSMSARILNIACSGIRLGL